MFSKIGLIVKTIRITGGLHFPYKGLLFIKLKGSPNFIFTTSVLYCQFLSVVERSLFAPPRFFLAWFYALSSNVYIHAYTQPSCFLYTLSPHFSPHRHRLFATTGIARGYLFHNE